MSFLMKQNFTIKVPGKQILWWDLPCDMFIKDVPWDPYSEKMGEKIGLGRGGSWTVMQTQDSFG